MKTELERLLQLARERSGGQGVYVQRARHTISGVIVTIHPMQGSPLVAWGVTTEAALADALGVALACEPYARSVQSGPTNESGPATAETAPDHGHRY